MKLNDLELYSQCETRDDRTAIYFGKRKFGLKYRHSFVIDTPGKEKPEIKEYKNNGKFWNLDDNDMNEYPDDIVRQLY